MTDVSEATGRIPGPYADVMAAGWNSFGQAIVQRMRAGGFAGRAADFQHGRAKGVRVRAPSP